MGNEAAVDMNSFFFQNSDFKGTRTIEDGFEIVDYQKNTSIRIWYNNQDYGYDAHWHHALEIILPLDNYYDVHTTTNHYHVLPGDILIIPPGDLHQLSAPEKGARFIYLFEISDLSNLHGFSSVQSFLTEPLHITKQKNSHVHEEVYQLLLQMKDEYFNGLDYRELIIFSQLIQLFVALGRNRQATYDYFSAPHVYKRHEYIQKFNNVLEYIDANYMEELTLDEVASYSGFSKYHFTRLFKEYTNYTFFDYLCYKRIRVAESLLSEPSLSITEIALQSGFSNISSFNRIFKKQKQCTPTEYRAHYISSHL